MPEPQVIHWVAFGAFVVVMLLLDLSVFHRKSAEPTLRQSLGWTLFWIALAVGFNALVWIWLGSHAAAAYLLGYVMEKALSMDNVFVFLVIFSFFRIPLKHQYRVLFWGILGAIVLRLTFVATAATLIRYCSWVIWIFGAFLIYTGIKLAVDHDADVDPNRNPIVRWIKRRFRITDQLQGDHFFVRQSGKWMATPLILVLAAIETTDLVFAVDSVPAIIGMVHGWIEPRHGAFMFIVFTSNVFAILGLRALYFLLAGIIVMFRYFSYGLAAVLVFVGVKMVADYWLPSLLGWEESEHVIPPWLSLIVVFGTLGVSMLVSLVAPRVAGEKSGDLPPAGPDGRESDRLPSRGDQAEESTER